MKPRLCNTTLSLALAAAAAAGCSGGASTGQKADDNSSAFREGLPPVIRDGDKFAVNDATTDYMLALRSAALKLTGNYPTQTEIAELQAAADQPATYANRINDYMSRPAFAAQQVQFWRDTFKMGGTLTVQVGAGMQTVSLETAPTFAAQLVVQGQPFNQIVTQSKGTCPTFNGTNGQFTAADCTNTAGQPVVGVLTDAGVQAQFPAEFVDHAHARAPLALIDNRPHLVVAQPVVDRQRLDRLPFVLQVRAPQVATDARVVLDEDRHPAGRRREGHRPGREPRPRRQDRRLQVPHDVPPARGRAECPAGDEERSARDARGPLPASPACAPEPAGRSSQARLPFRHNSIQGQG